jgi:hypothetical protein
MDGMTEVSAGSREGVRDWGEVRDPGRVCGIGENRYSVVVMDIGYMQCRPCICNVACVFLYSCSDICLQNNTFCLSLLLCISLLLPAYDQYIYIIFSFLKFLFEMLKLFTIAPIAYSAHSLYVESLLPLTK